MSRHTPWSKATARSADRRYIFHMQGHSELLGRLLDLERHYWSGAAPEVPVDPQVDSLLVRNATRRAVALALASTRMRCG